LKQYLILLLVVPIISFSCKKDDPVTFNSIWDEDIYVFGENLQQKHKNLFHKISETEFKSDISTLREKSELLTDTEIYINLLKIIGKIGDSHTSIGNNSLLQSLPFGAMITSDGVVITSIDPEYKSSVGKKISGINGTDISIVLDSLRTIVAYENESCFKWFVCYYLIIPEVLNYFELTDNDSSGILNFEDGTSIELTSNDASLYSIYDNITPPLYLSNTSDYYWYKKLDDNKTLYIQYNKCRESNNLTMNTFKNQIAQVVDQNPDIDRIAFDLRINTGGNSLIAKPFLDEIKNLVTNNRISADNVFVIIGRKTFSSAILNSLELQESIHPVFIGEPTGGKPNHFGEVKTFSLPHSRLQIRYSSKFFKYIPNGPATIHPDILIELGSQDLVEGNDPVLEYITDL
jgi:hypothetical protein